MVFAIELFTSVLSIVFDVYALRPEPQGSSDVYKAAQRHWESLLGPQRVLKMEDPSRLVDCFVGICGYASENFQVAKDLLDRRQSESQVEQVLETLKPLIGKG